MITRDRDNHEKEEKHAREVENQQTAAINELDSEAIQIISRLDQQEGNSSDRKKREVELTTLSEIFKQLQAITSRPLPVAAPVTAPLADGVQPSTLQPARHGTPIILSAPKMFTEGRATITGKNFGSTPSNLRIRFRVKESDRTGLYKEGMRVGPTALLGELEASNIIWVDEQIIAKWTDTSIELDIPLGYWQRFTGWMAVVAKNRDLAPPDSRDLEAGYQIFGRDGPTSAWFYEQ